MGAAAPRALVGAGVAPDALEVIRLSPPPPPGRPRVRSFGAFSRVLRESPALAAAGGVDAFVFDAVARDAGLPGFRGQRRRAAAAAAAAAAGGAEAGLAALEVPLADIYAALQAATRCSDALRDALRAREVAALDALVIAPSGGGAGAPGGELGGGAAARAGVSLDGAAAAGVRDGDVLLADAALAAESVAALAARAGLRARVRALASPSAFRGGLGWPALLRAYDVAEHAGGGWHADALAPAAYGVRVAELPTRAALLAAAPPPRAPGGRALDSVDAWLYINLADRRDRRASVLAQLRAAGVARARVHRVDAIREPMGSLGAARSTVKAIDAALAHPEWRRVAILQDDFVWRDAAAAEPALAAAWAAVPDFSVFMLGVGTQNRRVERAPEAGRGGGEGGGEGGDGISTSGMLPAGQELVKVLRAQLAQGIVVAAHYLPTLRANVADAARLLRESLGDTSRFALDQHWWSLQAAHRWRAVVPSLACQMGGYSDIERRVVEYVCP